MNKRSRIKDRIRAYLESIMFEPMAKELFEAIVERVKIILIEEEYEFDDINVTYEIAPGRRPPGQLIIFIKGKRDEDIKMYVEYEGRNIERIN